MTSKFNVANADFGFNLLRETRDASKDGSTQVSPYSVRTALTMAALGSRGRTRQSFLDTFSLPSGTDLLDVCADNQKVLAAMLAGERGAEKPTTINLANALWLQKGYPIHANFTKANQQYFGATVEELELDDTGLTRINAWVKAQTKLIDKIFDKLPEGSKAILTNALYVKTPAHDRFYKANDTTGKFFLADGSVIEDMPFMVNPDLKTQYLNADVAEVVEYRFGENGSFKGYLVVPAKGYTADSVLDKLTGKLWAEWQENLGRAAGRLALAPNEQEFDEELKGALSKMGLSPALSDAADFLDMSPIPLKIGAVKHKTKTKWTRLGFEGAAVTAVAMMECLSIDVNGITPFDITVDRPYLWFVEAAGEQLFSSLTNKPKKPDTFDAETDEDDTFA